MVEQTTPSNEKKKLLHLPRGRNASPWTLRIVLAAAVIVVLLAPLWVDRLTLNTILGAGASPTPVQTDEPQPQAAMGTDDPTVTWSVVGHDADATGPVAAAMGGTWHTSTVDDLTVATLDTSMSRDAQVDFSVTLPSLPGSDGFTAAAVLRRTASGAAYVPELRIDGTGAVSVAIEMVEAGSSQMLEPPMPVTGLTAKPGEPVHLRANVTGTDPATVRVRAWTTSDAGYWQVGAIDWTGVLQAAGSVGIAWSSNLHAQFTDFAASTADTGGTP